MFSFIFRTDGSTEIGTGHVMRCLTLADALRREGALCRFVCREHAGNLIELIQSRGHEAVSLPLGQEPVKRGDGLQPLPEHAGWLGVDWETDARQTLAAVGDAMVDWLVVDHYALDVRWETAMRSHCGRLMVIDDLADRPHNCDLLLDQNLGRTSEAYCGLVPTECVLLTGANFALLRPEFIELRSYSLQRRQPGRLQQLLIAMGGVDKPNITGDVLTALLCCDLPTNCRIVIVMGPQAPWLSKVRELAERLPWPADVRENVADMARVMAESDLAIGAAGSMAWERCSVGLPTLAVVLAGNQLRGAEALAAKGAVMLLPSFREDASVLNDFLRQVSKPNVLRKMQIACAQVTDGAGTNRVLEQIVGLDAGL